jgi:hypothetical protein
MEPVGDNQVLATGSLTLPLFLWRAQSHLYEKSPRCCMTWYILESSIIHLSLKQQLNLINEEKSSQFFKN